MSKQIHLKSFTIRNSSFMTYYEKGQGDTLLFLHGALSNYYTWRKVLPALSENFRCVAPNLPLGGHSIPLKQTSDFSPDGISELILQLLDYLNIEKAIIVANDTGGAYAQIFASNHPERIKGIILSNCEVLDYFPPPAFAYLKHAVKIPTFTFWMARLFSIKSLLRNPAVMGALSVSLSNEEIAQGYVRSFVKIPGIRKNFAEVCKHWEPSHTIRAAEKLKGFKAPVLILWGNRDDKLFPEKQMRKLMVVFPHALWKEIDGSKTYVQEDTPEDVIEAIQSFMLQFNK